MGTLQLTQVPVAKTGMLIRKPAAEVFAAFVEPQITTRFWFSKSSGRLEPGAAGARHRAESGARSVSQRAETSVPG